MPDQLTTGNSADITARLQGTKRVSHTFDDDNNNVLESPALLKLVDETKTGTIMVVLWGEELTDKATMPVEQAHRDNVLIKKIYSTGTVDVSESDITLYV